MLLNENRRDLLKERKCLHGFKINRMINAIEDEQLNFKGWVFKFELLILNLFSKRNAKHRVKKYHHDNLNFLKFLKPLKIKVEHF